MTLFWLNYQRTMYGRKTTLTPKYAIIISNHLRLTWSPEQIALHFNLCTKSIYNWIDREIIYFSSELLPDKARQCKYETRGTFKEATIDQKPDNVNKRN